MVPSLVKRLTDPRSSELAIGSSSVGELPPGEARVRVTLDKEFALKPGENLCHLCLHRGSQARRQGVRRNQDWNGHHQNCPAATVIDSN